MSEISGNSRGGKERKSKKEITSVGKVFELKVQVVQLKVHNMNFVYGKRDSVSQSMIILNSLLFTIQVFNSSPIPSVSARHRN